MYKKQSFLDLLITKFHPGSKSGMKNRDYIMISLTKKILLVELILLCPLHAPIKAIDEDLARNIAITGGILAGGASALGVYLLSNCLTNPNKDLLLESPIIGTALGYVTEHFLYQWLSAKTPSAKIALVKDCVQSASNTMQEAQQTLIDNTHDELIIKNFASDELLIAYITKRFDTNWPLVAARNFLIDVPNNLQKKVYYMRSVLNNAKNYLELAMKEMQTNTKKYAALLQEGKYLQEKIKNIEAYCAQYDRNITLIKQVTENLINTIALYPQFTSQAAVYESHIQHKEMSAKIALAKDLIKKALDVMQEAQKTLIDNTHDKLITKNFASDELFIAYITQRFTTNWPLVEARDFLIKVPNILKRRAYHIKYSFKNAESCLELVIKEMQTNTKKYAILLQEGKYLQEKIKNIEAHCAEYDKNITLIEKAIKNPISTISLYPQFISQAALYESHIQHEKMLEQQRQQRQQELDIEKSKLALQQLQFTQQQKIEQRKLSQQERQFHILTSYHLNGFVDPGSEAGMTNGNCYLL
ncbi:MAG: hypothetical protein US69_C0002G0117 [candidate division TM6 bacterium GW2011_GWF2_38_10]|nr:MAG: hypothetical protein US69_C0002G0117 [candidate division TM6 bacterium GW2011_GWF2_38_10]